LLHDSEQEQPLSGEAAHQVQALPREKAGVQVMDKERVHAWWDFVVGNGVLTTTMVEEFAALVAATEREACAQLAENGLLGLTIAKAIRARGEQ
jgi:hypothetical protein